MYVFKRGGYVFKKNCLKVVLTVIQNFERDWTAEAPSLPLMLARYGRLAM